jgi:hypothetical protein
VTAGRSASTGEEDHGSLSSDPSLGKIAYDYGPSDWFPFRHSDWRRIRERASTLADQGTWVGPLGWAAVGVVAAAVLGLLPWMAAYSQLPTAARLSYGWITGAFIAAAILSAILGIVCLLVGRTVHESDKASLKSVLADMDACYGRATHAVEVTASAEGPIVVGGDIRSSITVGDDRQVITTWATSGDDESP